jgi:hypothetical protein
LRHGKLPIEQIGGHRMAMAGIGSRPEPALHPGTQPLLAHQARDPTAADLLALSPQIGMDPRRSIDTAAGFMDGFDLLR